MVVKRAVVACLLAAAALPVSMALPVPDSTWPVVDVVIAPNASRQAQGLVDFLLLQSRLQWRWRMVPAPAGDAAPADLLLLLHDNLTAEVLAALGDCGNAAAHAGLLAHGEGGVVGVVPNAASIPALAVAFGLQPPQVHTPAVATAGIVVAGVNPGGLRAAIGEFVRRAAVAGAASPAQGQPRDWLLAADWCGVHAPPPWFHMVIKQWVATDWGCCCCWVFCCV
jgi:hypothetical protein